ncbi:hypothetical protein [Leptolyngbya sp. AN02str]
MAYYKRLRNTPHISPLFWRSRSLHIRFLQCLYNASVRYSAD